jgi:hypothetical protein
MTCWEFKQELVNQVILDSLVITQKQIFLDKELEEMMVKMKQNVNNSITFHVFLKLFPQEERAYHFSYDVGT